MVGIPAPFFFPSVFHLSLFLPIFFSFFLFVTSSSNLLKGEMSHIITLRLKFHTLFYQQSKIWDSFLKSPKQFTVSSEIKTYIQVWMQLKHFSNNAIVDISNASYNFHDSMFYNLILNLNTPARSTYQCPN